MRNWSAGDACANALVCFDPARVTFDPFELPSSPGSGRRILGRAGDISGAESANDQLVVVRF